MNTSQKIVSISTAILLCSLVLVGCSEKTVPAPVEVSTGKAISLETARKVEPTSVAKTVVVEGYSEREKYSKETAFLWSIQSFLSSYVADNYKAPPQTSDYCLEEVAKEILGKYCKYSEHPEQCESMDNISRTPTPACSRGSAYRVISDLHAVMMNKVDRKEYSNFECGKFLSASEKDFDDAYKSKTPVQSDNKDDWCQIVKE